MGDARLPAALAPQSIAIIGLAGRFPGAHGLDEFWRNVRDGMETLEHFSADDLDAAGVAPSLRSQRAYVDKGTVLQDAECFDAGFFGYSPREAQVIDPQHRVFLECASEALENAGYMGGEGEVIGVYAGSSMNTYLTSQVLRDPVLLESAGAYQLMLGNDKDYLCSRVSYKLDLRGPSMVIQTACSTSLVAVEAACRALIGKECDLALAGGVSISYPQRAGYLYQEGMIFSPDGRCRPFDAQARGTRAGAGAGVVVLKRLADALADGDTVHAVIRGAAVNNDGAAKAGFTAPSIEGQARVICEAHARAGIDARTVSYVEAHGTGTPLGDPIEVAALTQAFRASTPDRGFCRLGSVKANLGHLDAAAGIAGLIKTVLALQHRELPPLVNFDAANPYLELDRSPFVASSTRSPWLVEAGGRRRAGVSAFGIGGTNAHVVLEEAPELERPLAAPGTQLLLLSAKTTSALERATRNLADHLQAHAEQPLSAVAWTLQAGRRHFGERRIVVARDHAQAARALLTPGQTPVHTASHSGGIRPVAFLFSGQGSQHSGMGRRLYEEEATYREAVDRCVPLLSPRLGLDVRDVLFDESDRGLDETRLAQPLLFVTGYALACLWKAWGVTPQAMIGHSIGEYVAAHLAGVMCLEVALQVVAERGRLMQEMPAGRMAAVQLGEAELAGWLAPGVQLAAVNAPGHCTISGPTREIDETLARLQAAGTSTRVLRTSHAFHSAMMEPALEPFLRVFGQVTLAPPKLPYISNLTGTWITPEQAIDPRYYAAHLRHAVKFEQGIRTLSVDPDLCLLEVGPGSALTTLARLALENGQGMRAISSLAHPSEGRDEREAMLEAAGRLWLAGVELDWSALHPVGHRCRVPLPTYPFERKRHGAAPAPAHKVGSPGPAVMVNPGGNPIDDWFFAPTWARDDSLVSRPSRLDGIWLVLGQRDALTRHLMSGIHAASAVPVLVEQGEQWCRLGPDSFQLRSWQAQDYADLADRLASDAPGLRLNGVINLWGVGDEAAAADPAVSAYRVLLSVGCGLAGATRGRSLQVLHLTQGLQSVLAEPVRHPGRAVGLGPVLALPTEIPGLRMRTVDIEVRAEGPDVEDVVAEVLQEAAASDGERIIARRANRRWVRRFQRLDLPDPDLASVPLKERGVYLITGGLGGIGSTLARWLACRLRARLVLTSRRELPARDQWDAWLERHQPSDPVACAIEALREIEAGGAECLHCAADASDGAAMHAAASAAQARWGRIDGVVHAAGIAGAGHIAIRQQFEDAQAVFAPKIAGLDVLVRVLGGCSLDFVALMSSINAVVGAAGTTDYSAANAVLDAFVDSERVPAGWRNVVSIGWGPWRDVGMAARLAASQPHANDRHALQTYGISSESGLEAFARVLGAGRRHVVVVPFDLVALDERGRARVRGEATGEDAARERALRLEPEQAQEQAPGPAGGEIAPMTLVERRVAAIWSELLGHDPIGLSDDFFQLGGHSLLATRVLARVEEAFGARLALRDVFEAPTVALLSARILEGLPAENAAVRKVDEDREEVEF